MNREEVLERLEPLTHLSLRPVEHNPRTRVMVHGSEIGFRPSGGNIIPMAEAGRQRLMGFAGIPQALVKSLSDDTLGRVAGELLARVGRYTLVLREGEIVDVSSETRMQTIAPERVVRAIERAVPHTEYAHVFLLEAQIATIDMLGTQERAVVPGDLVRAGASVTFSPLGTAEPLVQSYVQRLACTNGATSNTVLERFGYGEGDDVYQWMRQSIGRAYRSVARVAARWQAMTREEIAPADRALVLEDLLKRARLSKQTADAIRAQALEEPPQTAYDAFNLITWATSHIESEPARVLLGRQIAATYASEMEHHTVCPTCRRAR